MAGVTGVIKHGWHPEKEGDTLKSQFKGLIKGKKDDRDTTSHHVAQPLSSLRDPNSFGPPPKHASAAGPASPSRYPIGEGSRPQPPAWRPPQSSNVPSQQPHPQSEPEVAAPAPKPYRVDTTGLQTLGFPPPPTRRVGPDGNSTSLSPQPTVTQRGLPALPPRLPPRNTAASSVAQHGGLPQSSPPEKHSEASGNARIGQLQDRMSKLGVPDEGGNTTPSDGGTTWAQKKAAWDTTNAFRKDPGSVSLSQARAAASTANNFRERHGDQVATGLRSASSLNERYGVMNTSNDHVTKHDITASSNDQTASGTSQFGAAMGLLAKAKAPPPALPEKRHDIGNQKQADNPPPIPTGTRPRF